jgi:DNA-binding transcriptional regulator GbsR (MarR family)
LVASNSSLISGELSITTKNDEIDYEFEILDFIRENPSGVTITDITRSMGYSRNTVSKYVAILEVKEKIYSIPVGRYHLYYSRKKSFISRSVIISMFKALFKAIKDKLPDQKELYKALGRELQRNFNYRYSKPFFDSETERKKVLRNLKDLKPHFEYFIEVFNTQNILQDTIQVSHLRYENNDHTAVYRFNNSEFLESNDDYILYIYMIAGIIEVYLGKELERKVTCDIMKIKVSSNKEDSYVDMAIHVE